MGDWRFPTDFGRINDVPGSPRPGGKTHTGYDIGDVVTEGTKTDEGLTIAGQNVYAVADGTIIVNAAVVDGSPNGLRVSIQHADGSITRYRHLASVGAIVFEGIAVVKGDVIGTVGGSGKYSLQDYPTHLHYQREDADGNLLPPFGDEKMNAVFVKHYQWGKGSYWAS